MTKKVAVTKVREFRPHADQLHGARVFQKLAEAKVNGSYQRVGCLAFCAFALEAYFNHLGQLTLSYWEEAEFASPLVKLRLLAAEFQVQFDASRRPLQTVIELFRYRNWLAHSRSESFTEESEHSAETYEDTFYDKPLHRWKAFATLVMRSLSTIDRFLAFNFRFGKVFAALMSAVFLLGFLSSLVLFLLQSRTFFRPPTFDELQPVISEASSGTDSDVSRLDDRGSVEKKFGDRVAQLVKTYSLQSKSHDIVIQDIVDTPKDFREEYISGLERILRQTKAFNDKNPSQSISIAEIANRFRHAFSAAIVKANDDKRASSVTRWVALSVAAACCMGAFLTLIIPTLLRIEENTRRT